MYLNFMMKFIVETSISNIDKILTKRYYAYERDLQGK